MTPFREDDARLAAMHGYAPVTVCPLCVWEGPGQGVWEDLCARHQAETAERMDAEGWVVEEIHLL